MENGFWVVKKLLDIFKKVDEQQKKPPPKFDHKTRKDSEQMTDIEKMEKGFN